MASAVLPLIKPSLTPPLDPTFRPAALAHRAFRKLTEGCGVPLVIGLERENKLLSRFETVLLPEGHPDFDVNFFYAERLVKFLLWQRGGFRLYIGGPRAIGEHIRSVYSPEGPGRFDVQFMGEQVYEKRFSVVPCAPEEVPPENEAGKPLGRHLNGCRIGFDLGASDRKVCAVIDGSVVYSEEVIWEPRKQPDPEYHYRELLAAIRSASANLPRVDAVGGSSAGILIDNRPMVASLFRAVPPERYAEVHSFFLRIRRELGVPMEVINDGDVTALAGSMSLDENGVLGIAMGSSEAAGFVDRNGHILGWLSELAFAPVDYSPSAPVDEWSGSAGCGSQYFSQQCVFRLAPKAGIAIPQEVTDAEKLKFVQALLESDHAGARQIWQTMGIYLGYGLAHYAEFYDADHVLVLGRCTSGKGGEILLQQARLVLGTDFPDLAARLDIRLPDEKSRRIGQSIAAASLPIIPTAA
jgi:predicted NBD/HSP70 family sugar kinase